MLEHIETPRTAGDAYSDAVLASGRKLLFVSGQVSVDEEGCFVPGTAFEQARLVLANMAEILARAGGTFDDILSTTVYLVDPNDAEPVAQARRESLPCPAPASTLIYAHRLAHPGFLVEISAIAVLDH